MSGDEAIIRLREVTKAFNGLTVLDAVSLDVQAGRTTVVIGPSGCGKSVLLKHMIGLLQPDKGEVFFHDRQISAMSERQMVEVRRRMGFLFQGGALFDSMTVRQNIVFPMTEHGIGTRRQQDDRCKEVMSLVALEGYDNRFPEELSGGQRKRVALARAIVLNPEVVFYDEPTTGLDPIRADLINELILKLQNAIGATGVVVTHDMASARKVGDRILMLHEGRFIADTTPDQLEQIDNEVVQRFVEGRANTDELWQLLRGRADGGSLPGSGL